MVPRNRSVRRTKAALQSALVDLLLEQKNLQSVTVQAICDRANISRSTFYLHFENKDEVLSSYLLQMIGRVHDALRAWTGSDDTRWTVYFAHIAHIAPILGSLSLDGGPHAILSRYERQFAVIMQDLVMPGRVPTNDTAVGYAAHYLSGGLLALTWWWVEEDRCGTPAQEMSRRYHALCSGQLCP
ncbi:MULTISPECIES: TetR/AcrR family transcriptional regulator [Deinococcus]|jgi:AcrR family transcriptional regulator|uniref:AcrR family transcriptional regulator n=2 Tax=Deinococcus soli (ex Cha et al. 2016) TaxID=1309411 RepID=A0ACC6KDZ4_9DEIO|nr:MULTISPECIES: TetR/AcrR family transcriptional regulator [Deinococcus]MDK2011625.1 TetR/AcrR family transcriptional regulator [Deinococcus sp. 43]MDR6217194.1 AcrR family transcriptional regulator [Deinococcus soli (ex Cha et al. 2016)]MDR6326503.1 AcrR family transcriptional regulator [Deinococcus soli (ex Cha et al. 2016)]MDR6750770.1 AcrR family transcriptional regulator [Deinococcus soli (ex Cha et al. 2016)]GGB72500.1 TetR family transcriptional regulator [Deinococcus soli (ex Cha et a